MVRRAYKLRRRSVRPPSPPSVPAQQHEHSSVPPTPRRATYGSHGAGKGTCAAASPHIYARCLRSDKRRQGKARHHSKRREGVCSDSSIRHTIQRTDKTFRYCFIIVIILETPISFCFSSTIDNGETREVRDKV